MPLESGAPGIEGVAAFAQETLGLGGRADPGLEIGAVGGQRSAGLGESVLVRCLALRPLVERGAPGVEGVAAFAQETLGFGGRPDPGLEIGAVGGERSAGLGESVLVRCLALRPLVERGAPGVE
ncbi:MAG TPA: hypothetical protein VLT47_12525, partial [Anaeromyxobacteraceae bacterium]|nr:hypothetical protein [Anaeromyxobacteraceae bacterium]